MYFGMYFWICFWIKFYIFIFILPLKLLAACSPPFPAPQQCVVIGSLVLLSCCWALNALSTTTHRTHRTFHHELHRWIESDRWAMPSWDDHVRYSIPDDTVLLWASVRTFGRSRRAFVHFLRYSSFPLYLFFRPARFTVDFSSAEYDYTGKSSDCCMEL